MVFCFPAANGSPCGIIASDKDTRFMGKIVFVTSFKGGVGKTTVCANLANALTVLGKSVLAVDGDFGMRCLDLVLGLQNGGLYDAGDVLDGRCGVETALIRPENNDLLSFLPAPADYSGKSVDEGKLSKLFKSLRKRYDYVLIDSSADVNDVYYALARNADIAIVVSLHQASSIRAAEKTAMMLSQMAVPETRLVINQFRFGAAQNKLLPRITEIIEQTSIRLLGVVPYDSRLPIDQERATLAFSDSARKKRAPYEIAVMNIASRLTGGTVPLLDGIYDGRKKEKNLY